MQIYDILKEDHVKVIGLIDELIDLDDDESDRHKQLIEDVRDELIPHVRAEESVLYNSLRSMDADQGTVMHSYKEHVEAETLLRSMQVKDKLSANWRDTAIKLKGALEEHIREEEGKLFTMAKSVFSDQEAEMMGAAFEKLKPEVREEGFMKTTLDMVANLMPPKLAPSLRKFSVDQLRESRPS